MISLSVLLPILLLGILNSGTSFLMGEPIVRLRDWKYGASLGSLEYLSELAARCSSRVSSRSFFRPS